MIKQVIKPILDYDEMKFTIKVDESFFSEQNMKHIR